MAISAGKNVDIFYVARDPLDAIASTFHRAQETGRYIPLEVLIKNHIDAVTNIRKAVQKYAGDDRVQILFLDNTGKNKLGLVDMSILDSFNYNNLPKYAEDILKKEFINGNISEEIYNRIIYGTR